MFIAAEKNFENRLKKWLEKQGIYPLGTPKQNITVSPCGYYEKRWGGGVYTKKGLPDLHIVANGINIDVEVKAPNGRPSELQKHNVVQINQSGSIAMILYPDGFENFKKLILHVKTISLDIDDIVAKYGLMYERGERVARSLETH